MKTIIINFIVGILFLSGCSHDTIVQNNTIEDLSFWQMFIKAKSASGSNYFDNRSGVQWLYQISNESDKDIKINLIYSLYVASYKNDSKRYGKREIFIGSSNGILCEKVSRDGDPLDIVADNITKAGLDYYNVGFVDVKWDSTINSVWPSVKFITKNVQGKLISVDEILNKEIKITKIEL